jgi:RNA polymerase sigma factor (sigma-70 family)
VVGRPQSREGKDLLEGYREELTRFFCRRWRFSLEDAEDLAGETSLRVYRSLHRLQRAENFEAWLYAIARNLARNHYARLRRSAADSLEALEAGGAVLADPRDGPADACERKALAAETLRLVRARNPKAAAIIYYRVGEGLCYRQIAQLLGETPENCRQLDNRYLRLFREYGQAV